MPHSTADLSKLRRPALLLRAARFGVRDYRRERDLQRLIGVSMPPEAAIEHLLCEESKSETTRQSGEASYSMTRHVELLIALLAEARLFHGRVDPA